jgi:lysophospholipase L1-like esterase
MGSTVVTQAGNSDVGESVTEDTRKLAKWFAGGVDGKKIVFCGDSTTWAYQSYNNINIYRDGRFSRINNYPGLSGVTAYARGENGVSLAVFNTGRGPSHKDDPTTDYYTSDVPGYLLDVIDLQADLYIICYGINDCRTGTTYTAENLRTGLAYAVDKIRESVPNACIILRMPNAHSVDASGTYVISPATAQNMMDRYKTAYRSFKNTYDDVLVWDSMSTLYPNIAPALKANLVLSLNADGFHPSNNYYTKTLDSLVELITPSTQPIELIQQRNELTSSGVFAHNVTNNLLKWDANIDPKILESDDWYKVYAVRYSGGVRASYIRISFFDVITNLTSASAQENAYSGVAAPGLVPGDIFSFVNNSGQGNTFVYNTANPAVHSAGILQWSPHPAGTWSAAETEDLIAGHPLANTSVYEIGYVYRHKYAHLYELKQLFNQNNLFNSYDLSVPRTNPYAVKRRFYVQAAPAAGAITVQTIGSETGGDLSIRSWDVTDTIGIPGVGVLPLTNATFTADTTNKRMAITGVTYGGALVDFSKYVIPQGYVLSAT